MKTTVLLTMAAILLSPVLARSQYESSKMTTSQPAMGTVSSPEKTTQQFALLSNDERGGGTNPNYSPYKESSMYMEPGWEKGYVVLRDKTMVDELMLRYDIYHQQMQFVRGEDTLAFSKPDELSYLFMGDRKFIYTDYEDAGVVKHGYFEVLHEGKCPLYVRRTITYHIGAEDRPLLNNDIFVQKCAFYVKKEGKSAKQIRACKKSILNTFSDKREEVARFMKDNKLNGKTCDQLKLVIAFYDSLP